MAASNNNPTAKKAPAKKRAVRRVSAAETTVPLVNAPVESGAIFNPQQSKAKKFNEAEDELLSRAWVSVSMNSIDGTCKKATDFWNAVHTKYELLQLQSCDSRVNNYARDHNQLKTRFLRYIQPNVLKFNKYYKEAKDNIPSGTPDIEMYIMTEAINKRNMGETKVFYFENCVEILHKVPKFDPYWQDSSAAVDPTTGELTGTPATGIRNDPKPNKITSRVPPEGTLAKKIHHLDVK
jgi:hypothetical protein